MNNATLSGRRVLVVEDEYLVAADLFDILTNAGATVFGPVSDVERAMEVLLPPSIPLDAVVLDINLQGELVYPAAEVLLERRIPFMFVTGYDAASIPKEFAEISCITKPFESATLIRTLEFVSRASTA